MNAADSAADGPVDLGALPPRPRPARRAWPWLLAALLLALLVVSAGVATALLALADSARDGLTVTFNGQTWRPQEIVGADAGRVLLGATVALFALLLVVPLVVLAVLLAVALGVGVALLTAVVVAALATSPLWALALLLWLLLRRRPRAAATITA